MLFPSSRLEARDEVVAAIWEEHGTALRRFLRMRLALDPDRDDVVQEVFVRLTRIEGIEDKFTDRPDSVRSYLFAMAHNIIRDRSRRDAVRRRDSHVAYDESRDAVGNETPEDFVIAEQDADRIRAALRKQKATVRRAFAMSRLENCCYREIADELAVSVSTVEKYISRALCAIREALE